MCPSLHIITRLSKRAKRDAGGRVRASHVSFSFSFALRLAIFLFFTISLSFRLC